MLQILERLQGEIEEVPRAAGWVEHRERAQPVEERQVLPLGRVQPFRSGVGRLDQSTPPPARRQPPRSP